ncbi:general odorant-binding protein 69a [Drosophila ficusphila]|uniref:general odorant-binding protein 69a n=1 Tax=Drosophila ficusphila TaxID=30025 RepID=UPI0007E5BD63|nr:general odorant-binding protein 69a [Drosophila ficusphila]
MASWNFGLLLGLLIIYDFIPANEGVEMSPMIIKQVKKLRLRCINQTGASAEIMEEFTRKREIPSFPEFKCFIHCMFDMFGLIDSQNVMHLDALLEVLPVEIHHVINGLIEACGTKKGLDGCETAYETMQCYINVNGKFIWDEIIVMLG